MTNRGENRFYRESRLTEKRDMRYDDDGLHIYWFDPVEGCWVAFRRVDCVGEEELPKRRLDTTPATGYTEGNDETTEV